MGTGLKILARRIYRRLTGGGQPGSVPDFPAVHEPRSTSAIAFLAPGVAKLGAVGLPAVGEQDVCIKMALSAISVGTERWALQGVRPDVFWPVIPGYMGVGRIAEKGVRVADLSVGDRALFLAGRPPEGFGNGNWMCSHAADVVVDCDPAHRDAEMQVPYCLRIPDKVADEDAVFAALAAVARQGLMMAGVGPGDKVGVWGLGMVGQFTVQWAKAMGAEVLCTDVAPARLSLAVQVPTSCRPDYVAAPAVGDVAHQVRTWAPNGLDVIVDTTGSAAAVNAAIHLLKTHGRFVYQGWYPGLAGIDLHAFHLKQTRAFHPCGLRGQDVEATLAAMAEGKMAAKPLITHRWRPAEVAAAYAAILRGDSTSLGQVFVW